VADVPRSYQMQARARGVERTRERILTAARRHFFELPYDEVKLTGIAAEAEVTQQTLLNHFSSKEGLLLALAELLEPEIWALRGEVPPGDVTAAVRGLMRQYEALGDGNVRLAAVAERIPVLAEGLAHARASHRRWLEETFADQLPAEPRNRRRIVAALYVATDVGTWKLLRRDLGHSRTETTSIVENLVRAAVATVADA
jgi:AcrR family transcriptional regulator